MNCIRKSDNNSSPCFPSLAWNAFIHIRKMTDISRKLFPCLRMPRRFACPSEVCGSEDSWSAGVSQGRISLKHPFLRWPITAPKVGYQHQYWLRGGEGERSASVCSWSCAMLQTQPECCLPAKDRTWRVFR